MSKQATELPTRRSKRLKHAASVTTVLAVAAGSSTTLTTTTAVAIAAANDASARRLALAAFAATPSKKEVKDIGEAATNSSKKQKPTWNVVSPSFGTPEGKTTTTRNKKTKGRTPSPRKKATTPTTESFGATWANSFPSLQGKNIKVHTLILGTHPSVKSLKEQQYYGHPLNAFWWICGDCLGFRRASGVSPSTGKPYSLASSLRHQNIIPYEEQLETLCSKGFAIWDVIKSCKREGSLDSDIHNEEPNRIQEFCQEHPTIRRIVFANGGSSCTFFKKHFKEWLDSGQLIPGANEASQQAFKKWKPTTALSSNDNKIECISALAVSPAAAKYTYEEKRDFWDVYIYSPGLADHEGLK